MTRSVMSKSTLKPTDDESAFDVEEAHCVGKGVLDERLLCIAGDDRLGGGRGVIDEQDGGLVVAEIGDEELAEVALVGSSRLLEVARVRYLRLEISSLTFAGTRKSAGNSAPRLGLLSIWMVSRSDPIRSRSFVPHPDFRVSVRSK